MLSRTRAMTRLPVWTYMCPFRNLTIFSATSTQSRLTGPTGFAGISCSAENVCTLASLGISLPAQRSAHLAEGQEIKRLPRASEARPAWLETSFLWNSTLDSRGLFLLYALLALCWFPSVSWADFTVTRCPLSSHQLTLNEQMVPMAWQ